VGKSGGEQSGELCGGFMRGLLKYVETNGSEQYGQ